MKQALWTIIFLLLIASAAADGAFMPPVDYKGDVFEPEQKALIMMNGSEELLYLQVLSEGEMENLAWVVPVPSMPRVEEGVRNLFKHMAMITAVQTKTAPSFFGGGMFGTKAMQLEGVTVYEQNTIGFIDYAILGSDTPDALEQWLSENNYRLPDGAGSVLDSYIQKQWYFIAMKYNTQIDSMGQARLAPILIKFKTDVPIFPLKISSLNKGSTEILLYTIMSYKTEVRNLPGFELEYASERDINEFDYLLGYDIGHGEAYITKLRAVMDSYQMTDDVIISQASDNSDFRRVVYEEDYFLKYLLAVLSLPLGLFLIFALYALISLPNNKIFKNDSSFHISLKRGIVYTAIYPLIFILLGILELGIITLIFVMPFVTIGSVFSSMALKSGGARFSDIPYFFIYLGICLLLLIAMHLLSSTIVYIYRRVRNRQKR